MAKKPPVSMSGPRSKPEWNVSYFYLWFNIYKYNIYHDIWSNDNDVYNFLQRHCHTITVLLSLPWNNSKALNLYNKSCICRFNHKHFKFLHLAKLKSSIELDKGVVLINTYSTVRE